MSKPHSIRPDRLREMADHIAPDYPASAEDLRFLAEELSSLGEQLEAGLRALDELEELGSDPAPLKIVRYALTGDPNPAKGPRCICINDGPYHTERVNPDCPVHAPASEPRNRPGAGWQEHTLCVCGGYEAGDHHFDRSLCACGAMHYYCNRCGSQGDSCDSDPAKSPCPKCGSGPCVGGSTTGEGPCPHFPASEPDE